MKRKLMTVLFVIVLIIGIGVLTYPTIADQWNTYRQSQLISSYENTVETLTEEDFTEQWRLAKEYNSTITVNNIYGDAFAEGEEDISDSQYWKVLNVNGDGVMGYIHIPKINVQISIYHSCSEEALQTGAGHLSGTAVPIGGENTHSVIPAHRGLPSAKLFTDVDQLEPGDMFYIHVLNEVLAYQVDQILPMVDKDDMDTLSEALAIVEGEDHVTLFTCTPYGVNTHRLLVRGTRVPYNGEEDVVSTPVESMVQAIQTYYMLFLIMGAAVAIILILILRQIFRARERHVSQD